MTSESYDGTLFEDGGEAQSILIVDDTPENIQLLARLLAPSDYTLLFASSGPEALAAAAQAELDLVLLDVTMPGMDGFEVCRRLKADPHTRRVPVIFLTARVDEESLLRGFEVGGVDYVAKPFHPPELLARVATQLQLALGRRRLEQRNRALQVEVARRREAEQEVWELHHQWRIMEERRYADVEGRLAATLDALPDLMLVVDGGRRFEACRSPYPEPLFGDPERLIGLPLEEALSAEAVAVLGAALDEAEVQGRHLGGVLPIDHEGKRRWFELSVSTQPDPAAGRMRYIVLARDVTTRLEAEHRLRQAAAVFDNTSDGILITDASQRILAVNPAFCRITGYTEAESLGQTPRMLRSGRHGAEFYRVLRERLGQEGSWQGEIWERRKGGEGFPAAAHISSVRDETGEVRYYIEVLTDLTDQRRSEQRIYQLSHHDVLTDLPNRLLFHDRLGHAIRMAHRNGARIAVLLVGLERFSQINDSLGHPVGDRLLQETASRIRAELRECDTVARTGGDEFAVLLDGIEHPWEASAVGQRVLEAIKQPHVVADYTLYLQASIGIGVFPGDGVQAEGLIGSAGAAMVHARRSGGGDCRFFRPEMTQDSLRRITLEAELRQGLERDELELYFQPQVAIADGRLVGAEVLVRWRHPQNGLLTPDQFIPLAEEAGLIVPLTERIMLGAASQLLAWREAGATFDRFAVNLSPVHFRRKSMAAELRAILLATGIDPRMIELEITESSLMENMEHGILTLRALRALGCKVALDDFGTGYSSLSYLNRLPVDKLKIDRSFLQGIPGDASNEKITRTILDLSRALGLECIAEGIETEAQWQLLRRWGCDEGQGFLFGRPESAGQFARRLFETAPTCCALA